MEEFLQIGIIGVALSFLIECVKVKYGPESSTTKFITVFLSVVIGTVYYVFKDSMWWPSVLGILAAATTFYNFFLKDSRYLPEKFR